VLATGSWPLQPPTTNFSIPKELSVCEELFQKFYQSHHQGRKLNWLHQLSKGEIKARYGARIFTFQVSTYQMALLLQFNNYESASFDELQLATQLSDPVLKTTLLVRFLPSWRLGPSLMICTSRCSRPRYWRATARARMCRRRPSSL